MSPAFLLPFVLALVSELPAPTQEPEGHAPAQPANAGERARAESLVVYRANGLRPRWAGQKISLSLKDADLVEVLRSFAKLGKVNLVIDPAVSGKVTVELHDVPWDQAMSVILKTHRLGAELNGRILSVDQRGP